MQLCLRPDPGLTSLFTSTGNSFTAIEEFEELSPQGSQRITGIRGMHSIELLRKSPLLAKPAGNGAPIPDIFQEISLAFVVAAAEVVDEHLFYGLVVGD